MRWDDAEAVGSITCDACARRLWQGDAVLLGHAFYVSSHDAQALAICARCIQAAWLQLPPRFDGPVPETPVKKIREGDRYRGTHFDYSEKEMTIQRGTLGIPSTLAPERIGDVDLQRSFTVPSAAPQTIGELSRRLTIQAPRDIKAGEVIHLRIPLGVDLSSWELLGLYEEAPPPADE